MAINLAGRRILVAGTSNAFGVSVPDCLLSDLTNALVRAGARVDRMVIPFYPRNETEVIRNMTAWGILDFGAETGSWFDLVIATSFPSYLISHPRKVTWLTTDFRPVLDLFGAPSPLFPWTFENEKRRALTLRLIRNALLFSRSLFFTTSHQADRARTYLDVEGELLEPPLLAGLSDVSPLPGGARDKDDPCSGGQLFVVADPESLHLLMKLLEGVQQLLSLELTIFCNDIMGQDILNRATVLDIADRVTIAGEYEHDSWTASVATASIIVDLRPGDDLNPVVLEAVQTGKPLYVHSDALWSKHILETTGTGHTFDDSLEALFTVLRNERGGERSIKIGSPEDDRGLIHTWEKTITKLVGSI